MSAAIAFAANARYGHGGQGEFLRLMTHALAQPLTPNDDLAPRFRDGRAMAEVAATSALLRVVSVQAKIMSAATSGLLCAFCTELSIAKNTNQRARAWRGGSSAGTERMAE